MALHVLQAELTAVQICSSFYIPYVSKWHHFLHSDSTEKPKVSFFSRSFYKLKQLIRVLQHYLSFVDYVPNCYFLASGPSHSSGAFLWCSPYWPFCLRFCKPLIYPSYCCFSYLIKCKSYHVTALLKSFRGFLLLKVVLSTCGLRNPQENTVTLRCYEQENGTERGQNSGTHILASYWEA